MLLRFMDGLLSEAPESGYERAVTGRECLQTGVPPAYMVLL